MKILIVHYLPSGEGSNTLKLLNHFKGGIKSHIVEELDLITTPPPFFDEKSMRAYQLRNFRGEKLSAEERQVMKPMDLLTRQFMGADMVVLATPMHNFSLPGMVKVYFDAIMQRDKVFKYEDGKPIGLLPKTKFLTLYTSMGAYDGEYGFLDTLHTIVKIELEFMGIVNHRFVHASTGNDYTKEVHLDKGKKAINQLIEEWRL